MNPKLKFPRLSNALAAFLIVAFVAWVLPRYGICLAAFALLALCARQSSLRSAAFDNTVDASLTLAKVMDRVLTAFVQELLPLNAFSLEINPNAQPLNGLKTAKLEVPFVPLQTNNVKDFDAAAGDCYGRGGAQLNKVEVTINKRKYLPWSLSSWQNAVTPALANIPREELFARMLAQVVLADILSVVTAANYANHAAVGAANAFDTDVAFDVRNALDKLKFPKVGRSMILTQDYDTALLKDNKDSQIYGSTTPRWEARIPRIAGMDEYGTPAFDGNADVPAGIVAFPSAILVAMAPLEPLDSVRKKLVDFKIFTHQESGISLVYKRMADEYCDDETELVECTYGYVKGQEEALLRLTTA